MELLAGIWIIFGIIGWGFMFAGAQGKFPDLAKKEYNSDLMFAIVMGLLGGPISIPIAISIFGYHGWRLWGRAQERET